MSSTTIIGKPFNYPKNQKVGVFDNQKKGAITGKPKVSLPPYVCEERPKIYDVKTGEWVYLDEHIKNNPCICYNA